MLSECKEPASQSRFFVSLSEKCERKTPVKFLDLKQRQKLTGDVSEPVNKP
jgi:hypothetical protein